MDSERAREEAELELDPGADTSRFRAFAAGTHDEGVGLSGPAERGGSSASFRVLTLLGGLAVVAAVVWLLLR